MLILTLRTDKPESEIGLYDDEREITYEIWQAHRQLAETIHQKITDVLVANNYQLQDIQAVAVYAGPGSFTGLRIGISVANALAASYELPIIGETGEEWRVAAIDKLLRGKTDTYVIPDYGAEVHITPQKK